MRDFLPIMLDRLNPAEPGSFHTSRKASPMFLLADPPCRATYGAVEPRGATREGSVPPL